MSVLNYPNQVLVTTGAELRVGELPLGVRTPATYNVTAVTPSGSAQTITVSAEAAVGATTISVGALSGAIAANTILKVGSATSTQVVVTSAAAASSATSLTVYPLNFTILNATSLFYDPGALTVGSTMISVSALPTTIDVGDYLTFGSQRVRVTGRSPAGATQLRVSALTAIIPNATTATTKGLLAVAGITSSPVPSPEPKVIETTNLLSGIGKEQIITGVSQTMSVKLDLVAGNLGGEVLSNILRDSTKYNREVYFELNMPNGEKHEGVAIVTAGPETGEVQDKRMQDFTLQVQGLTYIFTPSTYKFF